MIHRPRWTAVRRLVACAAGLALASVSLVLGATIAAGGGITEQPGGIITLALFAVTLVGLYVVGAGTWGGWSPGADIRMRIRSVRSVLTWAVLVGGYMCWGLPLTAPGMMTGAEWSSLGILGALLIAATVALIGISRRPQLAVTLLGIPAAYGAFMTLRLSAVLLTPAATQYSGPARTLSLVMAGSFSLALVAAFMLAWPLRSNSSQRSA